MKYLISFFILILVANFSFAQKLSMRDVFKNMPTTIAPYLTHNNKLDMIDFIDSNMKSEVNNTLNGTSTLILLTNDYLKMKLSPTLSIEMKLLPAEINSTNDTLVCVVYTYGDSIKDSKIEFYSPKWELVKTVSDPLSPKSINEYLSTYNDNTLFKSAVNDCLCIKAELSPKDNLLRLKMSEPIFVNDKVIQTKTSDMSITLNWTGKSFKLY